MTFVDYLRKWFGHGNGKLKVHITFVLTDGNTIVLNPKKQDCIVDVESEDEIIRIERFKLCSGDKLSDMVDEIVVPISNIFAVHTKYKCWERGD